MMESPYLMGEYGLALPLRTKACMEKSSQNIQDSFLNNARKEKMIITIYLVGGVRLNGRIKSFDKYSLILESNNQEHLVFKHAISTVAAGRPSHPPMASSTHAGGAMRNEASPEHAGSAPGTTTENTAGSLAESMEE
jgi:host factor-I protein